MQWLDFSVTTILLPALVVVVGNSSLRNRLSGTNLNFTIWLLQPMQVFYLAFLATIRLKFAAIKHRQGHGFEKK
jgi:hypothetical protein